MILCTCASCAVAGSDGRVTVIVKLKGQPLAPPARGMSAAALRSNLTALKQSHDQIVAKIARIDSRGVSAQTLDSASLVGYHYYRAMNGFSIKVKPGSVTQIAKLPEVEAVCEDSEVRVQSAGPGTVAAMQAAALTGHTGAGVTVAVIDSGIDYKHPDLGGGFGPGYKVIGGYDFASGDADPTDETGHGTGVAGVIAANGGVMGVAPDAKLLAYKVTDSNGQGTFSWVLAGIDRALDPDQNPATDDAADIINVGVSAKVFGSPDFLVDAVEKATKAGVLCVCPAGNDRYDPFGPWWTIYSPGIAESALTVGASDESGGVADFSSRGPAKLTNAPKPDCLALGVNLRVCQKGGGYFSGINGTSYSAAYVAGMAAVLKSEHPDWGPDLLKAAVMEGADDLGQPLTTQGSGRVNLDKSVSNPVLAVPASIGLGIDPTNESVWKQQRTITLRNVSSDAQSYKLTTWTDHTGITLTVTPSEVTVPAGGSVDVKVDITVDNSVVPDLLAAPWIYACKVIATGPSRSSVVPISFLKCAVIRVLMPMGSFDPILFDANGNAYHGDGSMIFVPSGVYDLVARNLTTITPNTIIIKEGIDTRTTSSVTLLPSDANRTVRVTPLDKRGNAVAPLDGMWTLDRASATSYIMWLPMENPLLCTTDFSSKYRLLWRVRAKSNGERYSVGGFLDGVSGDVNQSNSPTDLKHVSIHHSVPRGWTGQIAVSQHRGYWAPGANGNNNGVILWGVTDYDVLSAPYITELYCSPTAEQMHMRTYDVLRCFKYTSGVIKPETDAAYYSSPWLCADSRTTIGAHYNDSGMPTVFSSNSDYLALGRGPDYWAGKITNTGGRVKLGPGSGERWFFAPPAGGTRPAPPLLSYTLKGNISGSRTDYIYSSYGMDLGAYPPDALTFTVEYGAVSVADAPATTSVTVSFDTRRTDPDPPYFTSFQVTSGGEVTDCIYSDRDNRVTLGVRDDVELANVRLSYKGSGDWIDLPLTPSNGLFAASLPASLFVSPMTPAISLRVIGTDKSGNSTEMQFKPAFVCSLALTQPGSAGEAKKNGSLPAKIALSGIVTGVFSDGFYMENAERTSGIGVTGSAPAVEGDLKTATGTLTVVNGETVLVPDIVTTTGTSAVPSPLILNNRDLGGGVFGLQYAAEDFRLRRIPGSQPPVYVRMLGKSEGINNIGLLVKTWGKVTAVGSGYFYISDGMPLDDGDPSIKGIKVDVACPGNLGSYLSVTGISGCMVKDGHVFRLLRPRKAEDITILR